MNRMCMFIFGVDLQSGYARFVKFRFDPPTRSSSWQTDLLYKRIRGMCSGNQLLQIVYVYGYVMGKLPQLKNLQ